MKITIERFGPIKKFTYDLEKDLIVTYGNNNIGKSYAMQIVYLILKTFIGIGQGHFTKEFLSANSLTVRASVQSFMNYVREFASQKESAIDATETMKQTIFLMMREAFIDGFMDSCENTFGNLEGILKHSPEIRLEGNESVIRIDMKERKVSGDIPQKTVYLKKTQPGYSKAGNVSDYLEIYVTEDINQSVGNMAVEAWERLFGWLRTFFSEYQGVYFLPASRSGIYNGMNAFGSIVVELSKNRAHITKKIELPGLSEPISDYFIALSNIENQENDELRRYYAEIEEDILKGKVLFDSGKNVLLYRPDALDTGFEMNQVSSMVSEISPVVAFLKYIVRTKTNRNDRGKHVLFIEEPEAHLHPNNQIALMEIFAKLNRAGIKLIMSSHSNYVFNKLNNLVLAGDLDYHTYEPIILEETKDGSVSRTLSIDELGAEDENFGDVSMKLYEEREAIIERLNMEE